MPNPEVQVTPALAKAAAESIEYQRIALRWQWDAMTKGPFLPSVLLPTNLVAVGSTPRLVPKKD